MSLRLLVTLTTSALTASQVFTQTLAAQAHYAPVLGTPLLTVQAFYHTHGLYWPWQGIGWAWRWGWQAPEALHLAGMAALLPLTLGCLACLREAQTRQRGTPPPMTGHGTTTWATGRDIRRAGFVREQASSSAPTHRRILRFDGPENVLLVGPQRQGKGVGVIIPTLLGIDGHTITIDVRGETWDATAGYRATLGRVLRLAITQPRLRPV